jgi:hypothetical protein
MIYAIISSDYGHPIDSISIFYNIDMNLIQDMFSLYTLSNISYMLLFCDNCVRPFYLASHFEASFESNDFKDYGPRT